MDTSLKTTLPPLASSIPTTPPPPASSIPTPSPYVPLHIAVVNVRNHQLLGKEADIAKFALQNPSTGAIDALQDKFTKLNCMFTDFKVQPEDLEYMLWCTPEARCGMSKHYCPDKTIRLAKMKAFLSDLKLGEIERNITKENFEQRVGEFESILTAMGYRSIGPGWVKDDTDPVTGVTVERSKTVHAMCGSGSVGTKSLAVDSIGAREFQTRWRDDTAGEDKATGRPRMDSTPSGKIEGIGQRGFTSNGEAIAGRPGLA